MLGVRRVLSSRIQRHALSSHHSLKKKALASRIQIFKENIIYFGNVLLVWIFYTNDLNKTALWYLIDITNFAVPTEI